MVSKNDVVTIVTPAGEFVGRLISDDDGEVVLANPQMFLNSEQGMGFLPGVSMTGKQNPETAEFRGVVVMVEASADTVQAWTKVTSGIIL